MQLQLWHLLGQHFLRQVGGEGSLTITQRQ